MRPWLRAFLFVVSVTLVPIGANASFASFCSSIFESLHSAVTQLDVSPEAEDFITLENLSLRELKELIVNSPREAVFKLTDSGTIPHSWIVVHSRRTGVDYSINFVTDTETLILVQNIKLASAAEINQFKNEARLQRFAHHVRLTHEGEIELVAQGLSINDLRQMVDKAYGPPLRFANEIFTVSRLNNDSEYVIRLAEEPAHSWLIDGVRIAGPYQGKSYFRKASQVLESPPTTFVPQKGRFKGLSVLVDAPILLKIHNKHGLTEADLEEAFEKALAPVRSANGRTVSFYAKISWLRYMLVHYADEGSGLRVASAYPVSRFKFKSAQSGTGQAPQIEDDGE